MARRSWRPMDDWVPIDDGIFGEEFEVNSEGMVRKVDPTPHFPHGYLLLPSGQKKKSGGYSVRYNLYIHKQGKIPKTFYVTTLLKRQGREHVRIDENWLKWARRVVQEHNEVLLDRLSWKRELGKGFYREARAIGAKIRNKEFQCPFEAGEMKSPMTGKPGFGYDFNRGFWYG